MERNYQTLDNFKEGLLSSKREWEEKKPNITNLSDYQKCLIECALYMAWSSFIYDDVDCAIEQAKYLDSFKIFTLNLRSLI